MTSRPLSSTTVQGSSTSLTSARKTKPLPSFVSVLSPGCEVLDAEGPPASFPPAGAFSSGSGERIGSRSTVRLGWACGSVRSRAGAAVSGGCRRSAVGLASRQPGAAKHQGGRQDPPECARLQTRAVAGINKFDCLKKRTSHVTMFTVHFSQMLADNWSGLLSLGGDLRHRQLQEKGCWLGALAKTHIPWKPSFHSG